VVRRPLPVLLVIAAGLITVATPVAALTLSPGDARELPASSESRQVYDLSVAHFPGRSAPRRCVILLRPIEQHRGAGGEARGILPPTNIMPPPPPPRKATRPAAGKPYADSSHNIPFA